jgi:tyrosyl-tRNA synthetase
MGGSDQWGNITSGTELIRRKDGGEAFAFTCPLITKADGTKFGKSEGGNVWLDPSLTSPYKFYQFWLNCTDEDSLKYIKIFTLLSKQQIESLIEEHQKAPHLRILQKAMAEEITTRVHSKEDLETALKASEILFGKSTKEDLLSLDENTLLSVFEGVPQVNISQSLLNETKTVADLLSVATQNQIFPSKGEARKMIQGGGVSVNKIKAESPDQSIDFGLLKDKYMLVQKGKKNYYLVIVTKE